MKTKETFRESLKESEKSFFDLPKNKKKYKVGTLWSQNWADFKNGRSDKFDIFTLTYVDKDNEVLQFASNNNSIKCTVGDLWKYHLIFLDNPKKNAIQDYYNELKDKLDTMELVLEDVKL